MQIDQIKRLEGALKDQTSTMVEELASFISIDTSFPPGSGYTAFATLITEILTPLGFEIECFDVPESLWKSQSSYGPRTNMIAKRNSLTPTHYIYFHMDTVPAGEGWTYPPFELTQKDGYLYGRGTADMKGTISATLGAIRTLDQTKSTFEFNPVLLFCTDEEGGLYPGIRYLAECGKIDGPVLCLNGQSQPRIWAGCFGSIDLRIRFEGRAAHSGDPRNGINAIEEALPVLAQLRNLKEKTEKRISTLPPQPGSNATPLHARLTLTMARGGEKGSSLPGLFEINLNRRYLQDENIDEVTKEIRDVIDGAVLKTKLIDWNWNIEGHLAPVSDPWGNEYWPRWVAALSHGFNWPIDQFKVWGSSTSSDMGWVQQAGRREILLGGLSRPDRNVHAADEHTTVEDLMGLARSILFYLAKDFTKTCEIKT
ncbi:MAG: M20/M25/M40 family metallo-hydrolase [Planktomarina sp.]|jgi:succinyl-diaminopimelate desuccinylase|nr:M20/M25/M40 family metallo-hydrolase [Planktomarina sp.]|tara:strand:- start:6422 stop:7699 length:1278 start_codon:yes stop_codon:yes gene_type:complete